MTTHLQLLLRLRINGVIPPLPLYAFVMCTGTALSNTGRGSHFQALSGRWGVFVTW